MGCTEQGIGFHVPLHENLPIEKPTAPMAYPGTREEQGHVAAVAVGTAGLAIGAIAGAGVGAGAGKLFGSPGNVSAAASAPFE